MNRFIYMFCALLCVVDQMTAETIIAEVSESSGKTELVEIPKLIIPCDLKEGDMFHIVNTQGLVEIRCGEPDPS